MTIINSQCVMKNITIIFLFIEYLILNVWIFKYLPCFVPLFLSMIDWIETFFCWIVILVLVARDSANLFIRTFGSVIISVPKKVLSCEEIL